MNKNQKISIFLGIILIYCMCFFPLIEDIVFKLFAAGSIMILAIITSVVFAIGMDEWNKKNQNK